ncbi:hypothetical protein DFJ73DRAFT_909906 [Zopfochytrium polystomum]|nr:hypothetical protein DFJ73DRAFT_909906 [Zopfochytrium polystomum]
MNSLQHMQQLSSLAPPPPPPARAAAAVAPAANTDNPGIADNPPARGDPSRQQPPIRGGSRRSPTTTGSLRAAGAFPVHPSARVGRPPTHREIACFSVAELPPVFRASADRRRQFWSGWTSGLIILIVIAAVSGTFLAVGIKYKNAHGSSQATPVVRETQ